MKYNSIGEQLIAKAQELDPNYKPDKFNDMSEAIDVILNNSGGGYKIKKLTITKNGLYDGEFEAYKPVYVSVPPVQGDTLKALLDTTKSAEKLFYDYKGTSIDGILYYSTTSNVTNMKGMFQSCTNLTSIPQLDTSKVTYMNDMFYGCTNLTAIPQFNTSSVTNMSGTFYNCSNLTTVPELDVSSVTNMDRIFYNCSNLTEIHMRDFREGFDIHYSTLFTREALVEILNNLARLSYSRTLTMGEANLAKLTDEDKKIATDKGWNLR